MNRQAEAECDAVARELRRGEEQSKMRRVGLEPYTEALKAGFMFSVFCLLHNITLIWAGKELLIWQPSVAAVVLMILVSIFDVPSTQEDEDEDE